MDLAVEEIARVKAIWLWFMAALVVFAIGFLWLTEIPLGIPGEWTWHRISMDDMADDVLFGALQAGILGAVLLVVAWFGQEHIQNASPRQTIGWLAGLMLVSGGWLVAVQESPPEGFRLSKAPWVLYYPSMTGYFYKARFEISDTNKFIADYEALMAEGDVLHVGTHPPGMFLMYRGLMTLVAEVPALVPILEATIPESAAAAFEQIEQKPLHLGATLLPADRAVIWLGALLAHASVMFALLPLFGLLRLWTSSATAWKAICFWPLIPALSVFLPKCDVLFTGLVVTFAWVWLQATQRRSFGWGLLAGMFGWLGLCLSLVFLPIGFLVFLAAVLHACNGEAQASVPTEGSERTQSTRVDWKRIALCLTRPCIGGAVAVIGLTVLVQMTVQLNLLAVWVANYRNHAGFYAQYPRTKWLWGPVNAIELALALGMPVVVLAVIGVARSWLSTADKHVGRALACATSIVWGLLWLSGKNSGEAARLWIPLMPFAICVLAVGDPRQTNCEPSSSDEPPKTDGVWFAALVLQAVMCVATVMRVSGFHYGQ